jgi:hypothetical protein
VSQLGLALAITRSVMLAALAPLVSCLIFRPDKTALITVPPPLVAVATLCWALAAWDISTRRRSQPSPHERRLYGLLAAGLVVLTMLCLLVAGEHLPAWAGDFTLKVVKAIAYFLAFGGAPIVYQIGYWIWASRAQPKIQDAIAVQMYQ